MTQAAPDSEPLALHQALTDEQLGALRDRIIESGALGRSRLYLSLLDYLLEAAREGRQPKEIEIAIDVMGRDTDFDVSRDSVVRVYIHQLRKRLHKYYDLHEPGADFRLIIPKGQYTIAAEPGTGAATDAGNTSPDPVPAHPLASIANAPHRLPVLLVATLALNLLLLAYLILRPEAEPLRNHALAAHALWHNVFSDSRPILLVMGDYYIFGELDEQGRVRRMVREFGINSRSDLTDRFAQDSAARARYMDLDMTYLPEGSAHALALLLPALTESGKPVEVTMMSRLTPEDLRSNHIIYVGYISALDQLSDLYFSASGLQIGRSYDELYNRRSGERYISDAGLSEQGAAFRDIALAATFPAINGNQVLLVTGTRDAGLMHAARLVTDPLALDAIREALSARQASGSERADSFEAVFEVQGLNRTNLDTSLRFAQHLDPSRIWRHQER